MSGLIGRKLGMTSVFDEVGNQLVCTVIETGPCVVTQLKTEERDGYHAVQLGFGERKEKNTTRAQLGHFEAAGASPKRVVREFRDFAGPEGLALGDAVGVADIFAEGDTVHVVGTSKGKGFQGVVKRHGFAKSELSHGQQSQARATGSIGQAATPSRVFKGKRMPGRMGGERVTVRNLRVVRVFPEQNLLLVRGAVPGPKQGVLEIHKARAGA